MGRLSRTWLIGRAPCSKEGAGGENHGSKKNPEGFLTFGWIRPQIPWIAELPKRRDFFGTRGLYLPRVFYCSHFGSRRYRIFRPYLGGMKMSLKRICKFYDHSKCLLTNNFCDLDCSRFSDEHGVGFVEAKHSIKDWKNEELDKEIRKAGWRLR